MQLRNMVKKPGRTLTALVRPQQVSRQGSSNLRQADFGREEIDYLIHKLKGEGKLSGQQMMDALVADFIGADAADTCVCKRSWDRFWQPMLSLGYQKLKSAYTEVEWPKKHQYGPALAKAFVPVYEDIEIGYDKTVNLPTHAHSFLTTQGDNPVSMYVNAELQGDAWNPPTLVVQIKREHKAVAEKFLATVDKWVRESNIYKDAVTSFEGGYLRFMKIPPCSWKDVILPANIIKQVRRSTVDMLKRRATFYDVGLGVRRSILLDGPPGVGKTQVNRALSNEVYAAPETKCSIMWVSTKSIGRAQDIKELYSAARTLAPTLLVLEDVDLIGRARGAEGPSYLLGELLTQMDGAEDNRGLITVATTNDLSSIDYALTKRPGRFDRLLSVPLPTADARDVMLRRFIQARKGMIERGMMRGASSLWTALVQATSGMTGAYLQEVVNSAVIEAINMGSVQGGRPILRKSHFSEALGLVQDSFNKGPRDLETNQIKSKRDPSNYAVEPPEEA
jgi:cell division protease FtsH